MAHSDTPTTDRNDSRPTGVLATAAGAARMAALAASGLTLLAVAAALGGQMQGSTTAARLAVGGGYTVLAMVLVGAFAGRGGRTRTAR